MQGNNAYIWKTFCQQMGDVRDTIHEKSIFCHHVSSCTYILKRKPICLTYDMPIHRAVICQCYFKNKLLQCWATIPHLKVLIITNSLNSAAVWAMLVTIYKSMKNTAAQCDGEVTVAISLTAWSCSVSPWAVHSISNVVGHAHPQCFKTA